MKFFRVILLFVLLLTGIDKKVEAQEIEYQIEKIDSKLSIQKDYSWLVETTIIVNFDQKTHGIVWQIPYSVEDDKDTKILYITDGNGDLLPYKEERSDTEKKIEIGDTNKTVMGRQTYRVKYLQKNVVKETDNSVEIWWKIFGNLAVIESPYYKILGTEGVTDFKMENNKINLNFETTTQTTDNLTIGVSLEKPKSQQQKENLIKLLDNKKILFYTSSLAIVMILTTILIQKKKEK